MEILVFGNRALCNPLREQGVSVISAGVGKDYDIKLRSRVPKIQEVLSLLDRKPNFILVVEELGQRTLPVGMEEIDIPSCVYFVDPHLNYFWQKEYAKTFDVVLVTQKDYVQRFKKDGSENVFWFPWFVDEEVMYDRGIERIYDISFIGTVCPNTRPKRSFLLDEVGKRFPIYIAGTNEKNRVCADEMAKIYSSSKIVINESINGEVNFRTFEAMACGALLVTERVKNGLLDLFLDEKEIVTFRWEDLFYVLERYLSDDEARERIARGGKHKVLQKHTAKIRAKELIEMMSSLKKGEDRRPLHLARIKTLVFTSLRGICEDHNMLCHMRECTISKDPYIFYFFAVFLAYKNLLHESLIFLFKAFRMKDSDPKILCACAHILNKLGFKKESELFMRKALFMLGEDKKVHLGDKNLLFARLFSKNGSFAEPGFMYGFEGPIPLFGLSYYVKFYLNHRESFIANYRLGSVLYKHRFFSIAYPYLGRALLKKPKLKSLRFRYGASLVRCYAFQDGLPHLIAACAGLGERYIRLVMKMRVFSGLRKRVFIMEALSILSEVGDEEGKKRLSNFLS